MRILLAILGSLPCLLISAFCLFGFLATFEPTDNAMAFRITYVVAGIGSLVINLLLLITIFRLPPATDCR